MVNLKKVKLKKKGNLKKDNRGITLIALVITIIVLLILAAVSISTLTGDNGLLTKASDAKEKTNLNSIFEQIKLEMLGSIGKNGKIDLNKAKDSIAEKIKNIDIKRSGNKLIVTIDGVTYSVDKNGNSTEYIEPEPTGVYSYLCDVDGDGIGETLILSSNQYTSETTSLEYKGLQYTILSYYDEDQAFQSDPNNIYEFWGWEYNYPIWNYDGNNVINTSTIKKVIIYDDIAPTTMAYWFFNFSGLQTIEDIEKINTCNVTNMECLFGNIQVSELDLSNFDTSKVTNMSQMFGLSDNSNITELDLSSFNTNNVTDMSSMFSGCKALTTLDLSNFNTFNVTNMEGMFRICAALTTIYVGDNWDISNVTNSKSMFSGCTKLAGERSYDSSSPADKTYATTTDGYLTYKSSTVTD